MNGATKLPAWMQTVMRGWRWWMLAFLPVAIFFELRGAHTWVFISACISVVPLAAIMGHATEALADRVGPGLGGFLNATFGNAAELILAIVALRAHHFEIVRASITGSIIGNVLFVFGAAIVAGGYRRDKQTFSAAGASVGAAMLLLSVAALLIPAICVAQFHMPATSLDRLSMVLAVILLTTYFLGLWFSLRTHKHLYDGGEAEPGGGDIRDDVADLIEVDAHPLWRPLVELVGATIGVAIMSEFLVGAVDHAMTALGMNTVFVGVVVLAIVGNAAEHSTAVIVAIKDRMDIAVTICLESSKQVALFVAPVLMLLSLPLTGDVLTVDFGMTEVGLIFISVLALNFVCHDGETNWLEGVQLLALYLVFAVTLYFIPAGIVATP